MDEIFIVIPTYNPNYNIMIPFIQNLKKEFKNILIVNDGSTTADSKKTFNKLNSMELTIITHSVNLGKGRALKTAFNEILNYYPNCKGIVIADCDGQHCVKDIKACAEKLLKNPNCLILGCRDFKTKSVPPKSKFGNNLTKLIFKLFIGLHISDTQTGLRGLNLNLAKKFMNISGERYEYETNMLIDCKNSNIKILEVEIDTIYLNKNTESHFNPIKDSISIYKLFTKYIISSLSSFLVDILLFTLFLKICFNLELEFSILLSTIFARIISSLFNFFVNAKLVFKKLRKSSLIKYIILIITQMLISAYTVSYINTLTSMSPTIIKIFIDTIIFIANFVIQREWIFNAKKEKSK